MRLSGHWHCNGCHMGTHEHPLLFLACTLLLLPSPFATYKLHQAGWMPPSVGGRFATHACHDGPHALGDPEAIYCTHRVGQLSCGSAMAAELCLEAVQACRHRHGCFLPQPLACPCLTFAVMACSWLYCRTANACMQHSITVSVRPLTISS